MRDEEWRPVVGHEGRYEVSSGGSIRSIGTRKSRNSPIVLKQSRIRGGYLAVSLLSPDGQRTFTVHRIVAAAFHGPKPDGLQINHKDGDKTNNRADNLEYVTARDNIRHAMSLGIKIQVRGERAGPSKLTEDQVREIRLLKGICSQSELARRYGVRQNAIWQIFSGRSWRHVV